MLSSFIIIYTKGSFMLQTSQTCPIPLDSQGVWIDLPVQENEHLFYASIYNLKGRRMAGKVINVASEKDKHHWDFDHAGWPQGLYLLEVKGNRILRQTKLIK
jgi:starvation-inducible outer membrane lipoprotein